jgi:serine/threonine-protein kinase RsbT
MIETNSTNNRKDVPIFSDSDIAIARQEGRSLALLLGFTSTEATLVAAAISELARNIILHAKRGEISLGVIERRGKRGVVVTARDEGPGIQSIRHAMMDGYSTLGGLGLGLPGVRRLMDEFEINSEPGNGTSVTVTKWKQWSAGESGSLGHRWALMWVDGRYSWR